MTPSGKIGLPRMQQESGEKRVFLPEFVQFLARLSAEVYIEEGYGSRSGYSFTDYQRAHPSVHECSREEAFQQETVLVLRCPKLEDFQLLEQGSVLFSMLHYPTRPGRVQLLQELGVKSISLDSIVNDNNIRLIENMKAVAWNGLEAAFDQLEKIWPDLARPDGNPIHSLILGTGMVGKHAVEAATKMGNVERNNDHMRAGGNGAIALSIGRNLSENTGIMKELFQQADILVDATQRRETGLPVVPNTWLEWLPEHAVVVDLAVDPYTLDSDTPVVRGIEGIPQGNLDQYVFSPTDPAWEIQVPAQIPNQHRRTTVSCYSWPGIHPEACMTHYAQQLEPLMEVYFDKGYDRLSQSGGYFERALYRATLKAWMEYSQKPRAGIRESD